MIEIAILFSFILAMGLLAFRVSWVQVAFLPALILLAYVSIFELPGRGKDMKYEFFLNEEAKIVSVVLEEGYNIHLWLQLEDGLRYYTLDWDEGTAKRIHKALGRKADAAQEGDLLEVYVEKSQTKWDNELRFYTQSQEPDPPKQALDEYITVE